MTRRVGLGLVSVRTKMTIPGCFTDGLLCRGWNCQDLRYRSSSQKPGRRWEQGALESSRYKSNVLCLLTPASSTVLALLSALVNPFSPTLSHQEHQCFPGLRFGACSLVPPPPSFRFPSSRMGLMTPSLIALLFRLSENIYKMRQLVPNIQRGLINITSLLLISAVSEALFQMFKDEGGDLEGKGLCQPICLSCMLALAGLGRPTSRATQAKETGWNLLSNGHCGSLNSTCIVHSGGMAGKLERASQPGCSAGSVRRNAASTSHPHHWDVLRPWASGAGRRVQSPAHWALDLIGATSCMTAIHLLEAVVTQWR